MNSSKPPIYELGPDFYDEVQPARFPALQIRYRNQEAAAEVGLAGLSEEAWQRHFGVFEALPENIIHPLALRYHGHQFQYYNKDLGDGRGFLFAQFQTKHKLFDLGTKGSGQTPYSRQGDGRLTLKGAFREILATELLESYGVHTSKTFSVFETGESLARHDEPSPTRAAVLVRLSEGHIRFGTFQRLAFFKDAENIKKLLQYCLRHYYPEIQASSELDQVGQFLWTVAQQMARTAAQWTCAGFVHGVLNTDNMNITGESFDYGPYRFLPLYNPDFTAAYFDQNGLYSFGRQPVSVLWNLHQLGTSLQEAFPELAVTEILENFRDEYYFELQQQILKRLNLKHGTDNVEEALHRGGQLVLALFQFLTEAQPLYEQTFFDLHSGVDEARLQNSPQKEKYQHASFENLRRCLENFVLDSEARKNHEYFKRTSCCSLLIDELENIWRPIAESDDWAPFEAKLAEIRSLRGLYS